MAATLGMLSPVNVLVTGATGFLGSWLCNNLTANGHHVTGTVRIQPAPGSLFHQLGLQERIHLLETSHLDVARATKILDRVIPDVIFNLAGQSQIALSVSDPARTFHSNTYVGWALCEALRLSGRPIRLVQVSSDAAYLPLADGSPPDETSALDCANVYESSKAALDFLILAYVKSYHLPLTIARLGNVYGPGDANRARLVPSILAAIAANERPLLRGGGRAVRSLLYVEDAVRGLIALAVAANGLGRGDIFNLCGAPPRTVLEIARAVLAAAGAGHLEPRVEDDGSGFTSVKISSSSKAQRLLGWSPMTPLDAGLAKTIDWDRKHRPSMKQAMGSSAIA